MILVKRTLGLLQRQEHLYTYSTTTYRSVVSMIVQCSCTRLTEALVHRYKWTSTLLCCLTNFAAVNTRCCSYWHVSDGIIDVVIVIVVSFFRAVYCTFLMFFFICVIFEKCPSNGLCLFCATGGVASYRALGHHPSFQQFHFYRAAWNADAVLRWEFRPSNAWIVTKRQKDMFRFLYDTKDNLS